MMITSRLSPAMVYRQCPSGASWSIILALFFVCSPQPGWTSGRALELSPGLTATAAEQRVPLPPKHSMPNGMEEAPALLGLMLGHITYREAKLWVRADRACTAIWECWPVDAPLEVRAAQLSLDGSDFFLGTLTATLLQPDQAYNSRIYLIAQDGNRSEAESVPFHTALVWQFQDSLPTLRFAAGSCTYINEPGYDRPGKPYGGDYRIFGSIADQAPDAMFWLGDNTYLRDPDFSSRSGVYHRYAHTRATPEMQRLLRIAPNYAIWDDHDFGPNDADGSFAHKQWTLDAFRDFWANPSYGAAGITGTMSAFSWADVDVFLLDNRWHRSPNGAKTFAPTLLGAAQEDWLIASLLNSKATFKLVLMGGQLLNTAAVWETYQNLAPEERQRLLQRMDQEGIRGVVVLSGDRHHSEISRLELPGGAWVYDLTVSPLTSGAHKPKEEHNSLLLPGSLLEQRNFAMLEIIGGKGRRVLNVRFHDVDGALLFEHAIPQPGFKNE
ncbi:MAG: alkaline phosphatase family protein [Bacteroidetes bacterium]|nr:alkaline phosphatase family protein [Bacteroidota bacterium]